MSNSLEPLEPEYAEIEWIDNMSKILDNRFRIPGTDIRFGVDFLIGLVPYAGDMLSFGISGTLIVAMARHGASGRVIARMLWNVFLDTVVGAIPILGDLFDLTYKANRRNVNLLKEHYHEGKHTGSVWPVVIGVLVSLVALFVLLLYLIFQVAQWVFDMLGTALG